MAFSPPFTATYMEAPRLLQGSDRSYGAGPVRRPGPQSSMSTPSGNRSWLLRHWARKPAGHTAGKKMQLSTMPGPAAVMPAVFPPPPRQGRRSWSDPGIQPSLMEQRRSGSASVPGTKGECGLRRLRHQDRAAMKTEPGLTFSVSSPGASQTAVSLSHSERARAASSGLKSGRQFFSVAASAGQGTNRIRPGRPGQRDESQTEHLLCLPHRIRPGQAGTLLIVHWSSATL